MRRAPLLAALVAGVTSAALVGCGINTRNAGQPTVTTPTSATTGGGESAKTKNLPKRPAGVVAIEGPRSGSITSNIRNPSDLNASFANTSEATGVADLCAGRIDVLDISRQLTNGEIATCKRNGVDLADQPLLVASDAIVIATWNEHDVGGDCLQLSTVKQIFQAGSQIDNWSQVGFFDIPLRTTGREDSSPMFQSFVQLALGVSRNASLADVRGDYLVHTTDKGVLDEVDNRARRRAILRRYATRLQTLQVNRQVAFNAFVQGAVRRAKNRMLAIFDRENRARAATKVVLTAEQKLLIQRDNLHRIIAAQNAAQARAIRDFRYPQLTFLQQRIRRLLRNGTFLGTIGVFRFSYYELFENLLRPMEVWSPETSRGILSQNNNVIVTPRNPRRNQPHTTTVPVNGSKPVVNPDTTPWCVFPSQTTITNGSYPLARRIFLYVSKTNLRRPEVKEFLLNYVNRAQGTASANRFVPIDDTTKQQDISLIEHNGTFVELPAATTTTQTAAPPGQPTNGTTTTTTPANTTSTVPGVSGAGTSGP
jgi:ABC-type phosphate transport system substrate-binding protein